MDTLFEENSLFNFGAELPDARPDFELEEPVYALNDSILGTELDPFDGGSGLSVRDEPDYSGQGNKLSVPRRTAAQLRKNKKDDFDYNSYIRSELVRQKATDLDPVVQKRVIQKIRNRMSAQRSRQRQKNILEILEKENQQHKAHIKELFAQLSESRRENAELRELLKSVGVSKRSASTSDNEEETLSRASSEAQRENRSTGQSGFRNVFLVLVAVVAVAVVPTYGESAGNSAVKMGGVVPFGAANAPTPTPLAPSIESYCRKYCTREEGARLLGGQDRAVQVYDETAAPRLPQSPKDTSTLVCFDPRSKSTYRDAFKVLVDNNTISYLNPGHSYYGAFSRVDAEAEVGLKADDGATLNSN